MTITVVIPAYNEAQRIDKCLDALMKQTVRPDEIIVVDNASTDDTAVRAALYSGVRVVSEPKKGIAHARTAGFDAANTDIIARVDADTIVAPSWVKEVGHYFQTHPDIAAVVGNSGLADISPPGRYWGRWIVQAYRRHHMRQTNVWHLYGHNFALQRHAWLAIRSLLDTDDRRISEDLDLSLALQKHGFRSVYLPSMLAKFYIRHSLTLSKIRHYANTDRQTLEKYRSLK